MMFHVACPQPPSAPGANSDCTIGGVGMNLQNAARNGNTHPEQGNAFYNVIYFDSSAAMGSPVPAPEYYGALFFAQFAQGTSGLRPVSASGQDAGRVSAWRVEAGAGEDSWDHRAARMPAPNWRSSSASTPKAARIIRQGKIGTE